MTDPSFEPLLATPPTAVLSEDFDAWDISSLEGVIDSLRDLVMPDGIRVRLRRFRRAKARHVVLLVHGASAGSRTFMVPGGGLIRDLVDREFDVWTLDWRSSNVFSEINPDEVRALAQAELRRQTPARHYWQCFNLDEAARLDLRLALLTIGRWLRTSQPQTPVIRLFGHCVGGALVAQALSAGLLTEADANYALGPVVLCTLGLFYRVGLEGWLKGNEFLLEELTTTRSSFGDPEHPVISPQVSGAHRWPQLLEQAFQNWRTTPFAPNGWGHVTPDEFIERMAFMYGMPYHSMRLSPQTKSPEALRLQFGDMPLGIYMHCVRNLRVGYATRFDATPDHHYVSPDHFVQGGSPVVPVTLITGAENQVWHRDSIDRTHEWLVNQTHPNARSRLRKVVFQGYAHQDLLWADESRKTVYPEIASGLLPRGQND